MLIFPGRRPGPYEIFSNVSAGGMGRVSSRRHQARTRGGAKDPSGMACEPGRVDAPWIEKDWSNVTPERWQEVKKVLAGALERAPGERHAYLDQACAEPDLRREVESLIAAHEQELRCVTRWPAVFDAPTRRAERRRPRRRSMSCWTGLKNWSVACLRAPS